MRDEGQSAHPNTMTPLGAHVSALKLAEANSAQVLPGPLEEVYTLAPCGIIAGKRLFQSSDEEGLLAT